MSMWTQRHTTTSTLSSSRSIGSASSTRYSTLPGSTTLSQAASNVDLVGREVRGLHATRVADPFCNSEAELPGPAGMLKDGGAGLVGRPAPNDKLFVDRSSDVGHPLVPVLPARCHLFPGLTALLAVSVGDGWRRCLLDSSLRPSRCCWFRVDRKRIQSQFRMAGISQRWQLGGSRLDKRVSGQRMAFCTAPAAIPVLDADRLTPYAPKADAGERGAGRPGSP